MPGDAIVVGGGIGGLAAARGLVQRGWNVTVFEQAPGPTSGGAGLGLAPNAVRALDWLGLGDALRQRAMAQAEAGYRTASGRWLLRTPIDSLQRRFDTPLLTVHRSDLHRLLVDGAVGATLLVGHRVTAVRNEINGAAVSVEHRRGRGTHQADLVVAADGVHSRVRQVLLPEHPGPSYAGYVTWQGVVAAEDVRALGPVGFTVTWGRGKRFGTVPLVDGRVSWWATASLPEGAHREDTVDDVAARHRGWHPPVPELVAATPGGALLRQDVHHLATPLPGYARGHVALLGDAAHALTPDVGQGAALALEDAITLTSLLTGPLAVPDALAEYDAARRPRAQRLARSSARYGRIAQAHNPMAAALRNLGARLLPRRVLTRSIADAFDWTPPTQPATTS